MSTPRLRSSFPTTPQSNNRSPAQDGARGLQSTRSPKLSNVGALKSSQPGPSEPLIPFETVDAPSQRLYVAGFYTALWFWRLYDFYHLTVDETESLWLFMKWVSIDGVFLFGLPGLKIPWLEWSSTTVTVMFLLHAWFDGVLMFRIPIPLGSGLVALTRILYDRELSISENRVKPADILHNPSLILGRQIIHILPEGSAVLNPKQEPLCLDRSKTSVELPLQINQTQPISIELIRFDLESGDNDTITISASQAKKMRKAAEKLNSRNPADPLVLQYPVKKTGLYRLHKVVDETNLEVQRRSTDALVVGCPKAYLKSSGPSRCRGELSDISLEVEGTPPLCVRFHKYINGQSTEVAFQSIQPEDFVSPLSRQRSFSSVVLHHDSNLEWARSHGVSVPLNETLTTSGSWSYSVDEVSDVCGNVVKYTQQDQDSDSPKVKATHLEDSFLVHERPMASLENLQQPLKVSKGFGVALPVKFLSTGKGEIQDTAHTIEFIFTPYDQLQPNGEHCVSPQEKRITIQTTRHKLPIIQEPGLYTLKSISTPFCQGDIIEPASCLLINPPEPDLSDFTEETIVDKCAKNPIGLRVGLDFVGTPPFQVQYTTQRKGEKPIVHHKDFEGLRGQIELKPEIAGNHIYKFTSISDKVYRGLSLTHRNLVLEQDVKPSVSAHFVKLKPGLRVCIDETVQFEVVLQGEGPWNLEYQLIHNGQKKKYSVSGIETDLHTITTDKLGNGGEYILALISVTDKMGCTQQLQQEAKVDVRLLKAKAAFGEIEGKRNLRALEGKDINLPLRLSGEGPWTVDYNEPGQTQTRSIHVRDSNHNLKIRQEGTYELIGVRDSQCPGSIDQKASSFVVSWVPRPVVAVASNSVSEMSGVKQVRKDVCEGEEDAIDIVFSGNPPFDIAWKEHAKLDRGGTKSPQTKHLHVPLHSAQIKMDTGQAGTYEYIFFKLDDMNYNHDSRKFTPVTLSQRVHARPSAQFASPGKTYSFCKGDQDGGEEVIPITLSGQPPFLLDVEIRQNSRSAKPEPILITDIKSNSHDLIIPHRHLVSGISHLSIRRVRDANGERLPDPLNSPRVQISVNDPPSITDLEPLKSDYCVGDRIAYSLSGHAPFTVFYTFQNATKKAQVPSTTFRRIAEKPGNFTVTGVMDGASACKHPASLTKVIHAMPSVRVSHGRETRVEIHAGSEAEILFDFGGVPPFEFTYTRSENAKSGRVGQVLETKTLMSPEMELRIKAGEEGTYEVVAIRDRYCAFAKEEYRGMGGGRAQKLLQN